MNNPAHVAKKKRPNIKTILKNIFLYHWENVVEKWGSLNLLGKGLFVLFGVLPTIFIILAIIFDEKTNIVIEYIHMFAGLSVFVFVLATLFWIGYMFETPERRRKLYLILIVGLWLAFGYSHFFGEDPDVQYAMMIMAVVGSVWLVIPLFLSMFRSIVYYDYDDDSHH